MSKKGSQKGIEFKNGKDVIEREDFKRIVKELRNKWDIPINGFTKRHKRKTYTQWVLSLTEQLLPSTSHKFEKIKEWEFNYSKIDNILQLIGYTEKPIIDLEGNSSQYSLFLDDIYGACKQMRLAQHWTPFLRTYILFGKMLKIYLPRSGKTSNTPSIRAIRIKTPLGESEPKIRVEFGANTKQKDYETIWNEISKIQKLFPTYERIRKKKKSKRDHYVTKKLSEGKPFKEVSDNLPQTFGYTNEAALRKGYHRKKKYLKGQ